LGKVFDDCDSQDTHNKVFRSEECVNSYQIGEIILFVLLSKVLSVAYRITPFGREDRFLWQRRRNIYVRITPANCLLCVFAPHFDFSRKTVGSGSKDHRRKSRKLYDYLRV
jgi:hypothetical protein